jgi:hypothetical protein
MLSPCSCLPYLKTFEADGYMTNPVAISHNIGFVVHELLSTWCEDAATARRHQWQGLDD